MLKAFKGGDLQARRILALSQGAHHFSCKVAVHKICDACHQEDASSDKGRCPISRAKPNCKQRDVSNVKMLEQGHEAAHRVMQKCSMSR